MEKGYGFIKVFRTVPQNGDEQYWASDLQMDEERGELESQGWGIEVYHRVIKQCCGIERAQIRKAVVQKNHLLYALRAFLRLEVHKLRTGVWFETKVSIIREACLPCHLSACLPERERSQSGGYAQAERHRQAIRAYLTHPIYSLTPTA
jgi:hypothetical protein